MEASNGINPYLRTKVMTAGPEQLRLMLYDGALKFTHQGRAALEDGRLEETYDNLGRAKKIVLELSSSLDRKVAPELCDRLSAVHTYIYRVLVEASMHRETSKIDEALELLGYERETWVMLMETNAKAEHGDPSGSSTDAPPIPIGTPQASGSYAQSA